MDFKINKTSSVHTFSLIKNGVVRHFPTLFKASNEGSIIVLKIDYGITETINLDVDTLTVDDVPQTSAADAVVALNIIVGAGF